MCLESPDKILIMLPRDHILLITKLRTSGSRQNPWKNQWRWISQALFQSLGTSPNKTLRAPKMLCHHRVSLLTPADSARTGRHASARKWLLDMIREHTRETELNALIPSPPQTDSHSSHHRHLMETSHYHYSILQQPQHPTPASTVPETVHNAKPTPIALFSAKPSPHLAPNPNPPPFPPDVAAELPTAKLAVSLVPFPLPLVVSTTISGMAKAHPHQ